MTEQLSSLAISLAHSVALASGNIDLLRLSRRARTSTAAATELAAWVEGNMLESEPWAVVVHGGSSAHSGPGWYYWLEEFPEAGSIGPYETREDAAEMAGDEGLRVRAQLGDTLAYDHSAIELALGIDGDE